MKTSKLIGTALPVVVGALLATGCAQVMAVKQPKPFMPTTTVVGAKRADIVGELGPPASTETHGTNLVDTFRYVDGGNKNNGGAKTVRVVLYTAGDLFTVWLDQIVWMPLEEVGFAGTARVVVVDYVKSEDDFWHAISIDDRAVGKAHWSH